MVQSDPEASEGPSARAQHQLWCVREWETSSLPPPWLSLCPNSLRRRFYFTSPRSSRSHRCLRQQAGTWLGVFLVFLSYLWSLWTFSGGFPVRFAQDIGSPQSPPPLPILPEEEWEDCRRGIAETRMFEWTKEQKARVLPPKWREILFQEHHVSLYSVVQVYLRAQSVLFEKNTKKNFTSALSFRSFCHAVKKNVVSPGVNFKSACLRNGAIKVKQQRSVVGNTFVWWIMNNPLGGADTGGTPPCCCPQD